MLPQRIWASCESVPRCHRWCGVSHSCWKSGGKSSVSCADGREGSHSQKAGVQNGVITREPMLSFQGLHKPTQWLQRMLTLAASRLRLSGPDWVLFTVSFLLLGQSFLNGGQFYTPTPRYTWPCLGMFLLVKLGKRAANETEWVEARNVAKHAILHRKSLLNKSYPPKMSIVLMLRNSLGDFFPSKNPDTLPSDLASLKSILTSHTYLLISKL